MKYFQINIQNCKKAIKTNKKRRNLQSNLIKFFAKFTNKFKEKCSDNINSMNSRKKSVKSDVNTSDYIKIYFMIISQLA